MSTPSERSPEPCALELMQQISRLENRFVELFVDNQNKELLKSVHVQLEVLKAELRLRNKAKGA
jgi:hypothetical protein